MISSSIELETQKEINLLDEFLLCNCIFLSVTLKLSLNN